MLDAAGTWKITVDEFDRNHDNRIQRDEMTKGFAFIQRPELPKDNPGYGLPVNDMDTLLRIFDHDKNGIISEGEWMETMSGFAALSQPYLAAIRPGAIKDARESGFGWYHGKAGFDTFSNPKSVFRQTMLFDIPKRFPPADKLGFKLFRHLLK